MCGTNNSGVIYLVDDPSPPGVSLSPGAYTYFDPCPCVDSGECPWCGSRLVGVEDEYGDGCTLECSAADCEWTWLKAVSLSQESPDMEDRA
jgi:hypothetical protein